MLEVKVAYLSQRLLVPRSHGCSELGREPLVEPVGAPRTSARLPVAALGECEKPCRALGSAGAELRCRPELKRVAGDVEVPKALGRQKGLDGMALGSVGVAELDGRSREQSRGDHAQPGLAHGGGQVVGGLRELLGLGRAAMPAGMV